MNGRTTGRKDERTNRPAGGRMSGRTVRLRTNGRIKHDITRNKRESRKNKKSAKRWQRSTICVNIRARPSPFKLVDLRFVVVAHPPPPSQLFGDRLAEETRKVGGTKDDAAPALQFAVQLRAASGERVRHVAGGAERKADEAGVHWRHVDAASRRRDNRKGAGESADESAKTVAGEDGAGVGAEQVDVFEGQLVERTSLLFQSGNIGEEERIQFVMRAIL